MARAGHEPAEDRNKALSRLLERYRPPLRSHLICRKRLETERADDLLQSFIARQVLARELCALADRQRGRFRTFVLTALDRFVFNELRNERVRQRHLQSSGCEGSLSQIADSCDRHDAFDIEWARVVLAQALRRMRQECRGLGRATIWAIFRARILRPIFTDRQPESYDRLVHRLGFASPSQASNALITSKRMFVRTLRAVVGEYEMGEADVDAELADLREILSGSRAGRRRAR